MLSSVGTTSSVFTFSQYLYPACNSISSNKQYHGYDIASSELSSNLNVNYRDVIYLADFDIHEERVDAREASYERDEISGPLREKGVREKVESKKETIKKPA